MPRKYPAQTRMQVIELARAGTRVAQLAATFGMSEATIYSWLKQEQIDRGEIDASRPIRPSSFRPRSAGSASSRPSSPSRARSTRSSSRGIFPQKALPLRRRLPRSGRDRLDAVGGALLAATAAFLLICIVAALVERVDALSASVGDSRVIDGLSAVVPLPGGLVSAEGADPEVAGTESRARSTSVNVTRDPQVRAAKASVVKIGVASCGSGRTGSGWIAADGIVVTAAHVVAQSEVISLQVQGKGQRHAAQAIWYDEMGDVAILRSSGLSGQPALAIEDRARPGARLAMLGFPGGGPYRVRPARLGLSSTIGRVEKGNPHATRQGKRLIADARPGNSGGPVVDAKGHVVGVVFARTSQDTAYAVSSATVQHALRRAQGPVDTGACKCQQELKSAPVSGTEKCASGRGRAAGS